MCSAQCIAADAQYCGVAGAQHPGGVGKYVGAAFEDKRDDAQRRDHLLDIPAVMFDAADYFAARRWRVTPGAQPGDHVAAHPLIGKQSRGRATACLGPFDVGAIGGFDLRPALRIFQALGKQVEELADGFIGHRRQRCECRSRTLDCHRSSLLIGHGDQQQLTSDLLDQQMVTGLKPRSQFGADHGDAVTSERDRRASNQTFERKRHEADSPCRGRPENVADYWLKYTSSIHRKPLVGVSLLAMAVCQTR